APRGLGRPRYRLPRIPPGPVSRAAIREAVERYECLERLCQRCQHLSSRLSVRQPRLGRPPAPASIELLSGMRVAARSYDDILRLQADHAPARAAGLHLSERGLSPAPRETGNRRARVGTAVRLPRRSRSIR